MEKVTLRVFRELDENLFIFTLTDFVFQISVGFLFYTLFTSLEKQDKKWYKNLKHSTTPLTILTMTFLEGFDEQHLHFDAWVILLGAMVIGINFGFNLPELLLKENKTKTKQPEKQTSAVIPKKPVHTSRIFVTDDLEIQELVSLAERKLAELKTIYHDYVEINHNLEKIEKQLNQSKDSFSLIRPEHVKQSTPLFKEILESIHDELEVYLVEYDRSHIIALEKIRMERTL